MPQWSGLVTDVTYYYAIGSIHNHNGHILVTLGHIFTVSNSKTDSSNSGGDDLASILGQSANTVLSRASIDVQGPMS